MIEIRENGGSSWKFRLKLKYFLNINGIVHNVAFPGCINRMVQREKPKMPSFKMAVKKCKITDANLKNSKDCLDF